MPLLDLFSFLLRHVEDGKKQQLSGEINRIQEVTLFTARPGPARSACQDNTYRRLT